MFFLLDIRDRSGGMQPPIADVVGPDAAMMSQESSPQSDEETPRKFPWKRLMPVVVFGLLGVLFFSGRGRTKTLSAFERRVRVRLQNMEPEINYDMFGGGVMTMEGDGVFGFLDLNDIWADYQAEAIDITEAAGRAVVPVRDAKALAEDFPPWEVARDRIAALPLTRASIHPLLSQDKAATQYCIRRGSRGMSLYLVLLPEKGSRLTPVLKSHVERWRADSQVELSETEPRGNDVAPPPSDASHAVAAAVERLESRGAPEGLFVRDFYRDGSVLWLYSPDSSIPVLAYVALENFPDLCVEALREGEHVEPDSGPINRLDLICDSPWKVTLRFSHKTGDEAFSDAPADWFIRFGRNSPEEEWSVWINKGKMRLNP